MATIKSYTSLEQSRKLAEILPIESADMHYERAHFEGNKSDWFISLGKPIKSDDIIPAWSLSSLLGILPVTATLLKDGNISNIGDVKYSCECSMVNIHNWFDNPVDACVAVIKKLNKLKML